MLLDIAPETAVSRKGDGRDRFERDLPLLSRVRESYRRQAVRHGWIVIDGEQSPDEVTTAAEQGRAVEDDRQAANGLQRERPAIPTCLASPQSRSRS